jgi:hypothetical protein
VGLNKVGIMAPTVPMCYLPSQKLWLENIGKGNVSLQCIFHH